MVEMRWTERDIEFHDEFQGALQRAADPLFRELSPSLVVTARIVYVARSSDDVLVEDDRPWHPNVFQDVHVEVAREEQRRREDDAKKEPRDRAFLPFGTDFRSLAVEEVVGKRVRDFDDAHALVSVTSTPQRLFDVDAIALLQFDREAFTRFDVKAPDGRRVSLLRSAALVLLRRAMSEMRKYEAWPILREDPFVLLREAAEHLMMLTLWRKKPIRLTTGLFGWIDAVSAMGYERRSSRGAIAFTTPETTVEEIISFRNPVPLRKTRWVRKLVELTSAGLALVVNDKNEITGLARDEGMGIATHLTGRHRWQFRVSGSSVFACSDGAVTLPTERIDPALFQRDLRRVIPELTGEAADKIWDIVDKLSSGASHGALVVVATDAASEATRLQSGGTPIVPKDLGSDLALAAASIDGALLLDADGVCHSLGVILDGNVSEESKGAPARGARYNSALRYLASCRARNSKAVAIVISEDGSTDIIPKLRPPTTRSELDRRSRDLQTLAPNDYRRRSRTALWLWNYMDYLDETTFDLFERELNRALFFDPNFVGAVFDNHESDVDESA